MAQREPTAAEALWGHLPGREEYVAKWKRNELHRKETVGEALWGRGPFWDPQREPRRPPTKQTDDARKLAADLRELGKLPHMKRKRGG